MEKLIEFDNESCQFYSIRNIEIIKIDSENAWEKE